MQANLQRRAPAAVLCAAAAVLSLAFAAAAHAGDDPAPAPMQREQQVVVPQVDRRDVNPPKFPSNDFELGTFIGTYGTQNFGSSLVGGVRLGYHVTEDFFIEGVYAQTRVSDDAFRQVLPGGVFPQGKETLKYYNVSLGYNVLPGEVFIGRNHAKASALYLIGGVGSTKFIDQDRQTFNFGLGTRVFFTDWMAVQVDMRDHVYSLDLLGKRQDTQNLEFTAGITFFF
jgi:outer membrane beta-barrel protein